MCGVCLDSLLFHVSYSTLVFQAVTGSFSSRVDQNCSEGSSSESKYKTASKQLLVIYHDTTQAQH